MVHKSNCGLLLVATRNSSGCMLQTGSQCAEERKIQPVECQRSKNGLRNLAVGVALTEHKIGKRNQHQYLMEVRNTNDVKQNPGEQGKETTEHLSEPSITFLLVHSKLSSRHTHQGHLFTHCS